MAEDAPVDPHAAGARRGPSARLPFPRPRGPLTRALQDVLIAAPGSRFDAVRASLGASWAGPGDPALLFDEDFQLALTLLYETHYRGIEGVDDAWEWDPGLLSARKDMEAAFEAALRAFVPPPADPTTVAERLFDLTAHDESPSLSRYVAKRADLAQARELLVLKSLYQLKEADPHTWAIPRLAGAPKAALVEIQADEYGGGRPGRMHAELFARALRGVGLDDTYGAYIDLLPAPSLTAMNVMSLFGLHRRLRGAIVGHLAAFEMTSSIPNRLYGDGFRRLGFGPETTWYFDEHVEADAVHEQIAGRDLAERLATQEPSVRADIFFGAATCLAVEGEVARHALDRWQAGASALSRPLARVDVPTR